MNLKSSLVLALLMASVLVLTACAPQANAPDLPGSSWKLVSYGPLQTQTPAATGIKTSLEFDNQGRLNGNMGCNSFGGNFVVKGNQLVISQMISTMMACPGPQMDQELATLQVLNGTLRFQMDDSRLVIYSADGASAITLSRDS